MRQAMDLECGTVVITAGKRLSRYLLDVDTRARLARGETVWETADVIPWVAWLTRCLREAAVTGDESVPHLLSPMQERVLWERAIGEDGESPLLQAALAARNAGDAWSTVHAWALPHPRDEESDNEDMRAFARWAGRYDGWCTANGWLDRARLADLVAERFAAGTISAPARIILAGFDELNPQQRRLVETLRARGTVVEVSEARRREATVVRTALADALEEIAMAAAWARDRLAQNPDARIAVVVPDLGVRRRKIERVFDDVLHPGRVLPGGTDEVRAYNISLGEPLTGYAIIKAALRILELAVTGLPTEEAGVLLRSPYLARGETELTRRALLDARMREFGIVRVTPKTLIWLAEGRDERGAPRSYGTPGLKHALESLQQAVARTGEGQSPRHWAETFSRWLAAMGWPGERTADSAEHQALRAWQELLPELARLDLVAPVLSGREALAYLGRLARETLFQPETPDVPVQVLGILEAAGMEFDHLWLMGMHDELWPPSPRPNPFLSFSLQHSRGVPHASAERELAFCERTTARLLGSAAEVIVSYPVREADRDLLPSPLIVDLPEIDLARCNVRPRSGYMSMVHEARRMETLDDDRARELREGSRAPGGAVLLKHQAACPFRAFAEARLGATPLKEVQVVLDAAGRGTLVHLTLEYFWTDVKTHPALAALDDQALSDRIAAAVDRAIGHMEKRRPKIFTEAFIRLERERLAALLREWLALEKQREPFEVIGQEEECIIAIRGIEISTKVDRIDRLADGRKLVIDYKTGKVSVGDWMEDRPKEPQLPLYGLSMDRLGGLAFGRVRAGESGFAGLTVNAVLPGVKPYNETEYAHAFESWTALLAYWRKVIGGLADAYRVGYARVDPRKYPDACDHCTLKPLCRIHERHARLGRADIEEEHHYE